MVTPRSSCSRMAAQMASDWLLMIFTSVRLAPIISILSMTTVWMSTITMPYSTCGIGLNTACISRTMMSKASMVADTGSLNHLLSTSGGMSRPPVDAPERMTMPSETPMPRPAKTVQRKMSSVSTRPFRHPLEQGEEGGAENTAGQRIEGEGPAQDHPAPDQHGEVDEEQPA